MRTIRNGQGVLLGMLILVLAAPTSALAQFTTYYSPPPPGGASGPQILGQEELAQVLAPIALYPDALLAQIFMASTYPLDVVQAARWVRDNAHLTGEQLESAVQQQPWDPSVKSLTAFRHVLAMMEEHLEWTQRLGDAFLAQQPEVMATVQALRARAQAAGYLQNAPQQAIIVEPQVIRIEPVSPEVVYVPIYDPIVVYGPWWYPAYPPYAWRPRVVVGGTVFSFGIGVRAGRALWGGFDWRRHSIHIANVHRFNSFNRTHITSPVWRHDPSHRRFGPPQERGGRQRLGQGARPRPGAIAPETFRGPAPEPAQGTGRSSFDRRPIGGSAPAVADDRRGRAPGSQAFVEPRPAEPQRPRGGFDPRTHQVPQGGSALPQAPETPRRPETQTPTGGANPGPAGGRQRRAPGQQTPDASPASRSQERFRWGDKARGGQPPASDRGGMNGGRAAVAAPTPAAPVRPSDGGAPARPAPSISRNPQAAVAPSPAPTPSGGGSGAAGWRNRETQGTVSRPSPPHDQTRRPPPGRTEVGGTRPRD